MSGPRPMPYAKLKPGMKLIGLALCLTASVTLELGWTFDTVAWFFIAGFCVLILNLPD